MNIQKLIDANFKCATRSLKVGFKYWIKSIWFRIIGKKNISIMYELLAHYYFATAKIFLDYAEKFFEIKEER